MRKIGYLRVSTKKQRHDRQTRILKQQCDELFIETASAATLARPVYDRLVQRLREGDEVVILDIDRAYRNTRDALNEFHLLSARGIRMRVINFPIDPNSEEGYYSFVMQIARAELERRMISRRTKEGLAAARERGKILGRPMKLSECQVADAFKRFRAGEGTIMGLAKEYRVARWTLTRALKRAGHS